MINIKIAFVSIIAVIMFGGCSSNSNINSLTVVDICVEGTTYILARYTDTMGRYGGMSIKYDSAGNIIPCVQQPITAKILN